MEAECSDGDLALGKLGYEAELALAVGSGGLCITQDVELVTEGCAATSVWMAEPDADADRWRFVPQAEVTLPPATRCGASQREPTVGSLSLSGQTLEMVVHSSAWCRGFDARFVYRRIEPERLTPRQLVARYVAHWNRQDAAAIGELFASNASLIEPFTRTDDGNFKRHEGRAAVEAWHRAAFDSASWLAMRLTALEVSDAQAGTVAGWEYMDDKLARPLRGRNLFVIGAGEIYESEVQLITDPEPQDAQPPEDRAGGSP